MKFLAVMSIISFYVSRGADVGIPNPHVSYHNRFFGILFSNESMDRSGFGRAPTDNQ